MWASRAHYHHVWPIHHCTLCAGNRDLHTYFFSDWFLIFITLSVFHTRVSIITKTVEWKQNASQKPKKARFEKKINRKYHFSRRQRRKILGQKMKRTQVQLQRRMNLLRSMMTYHMKPGKTRNKESFSPVGPVYTCG